MNFFESQQLARRQSRWLLLLYVLSLAGVVLAIDAAVLFSHRTIHVSPLAGPAEYPALSEWARLNPGILLWTTGAVLALVGGASLWRMLRLRAGGSVVAEARVAAPPGSRRSSSTGGIRRGTRVSEIATLSSPSSLTNIVSGASLRGET